MLVTGEAQPEGAEPSVQLVTLRDRFALDNPNAASLRFVHGASTISIIIGSVTDGVIQGMSILASDLAWRGESDEVTLQELEFQIGVAADDGLRPPLTPIADFHFPANGGAREWVIVAGDPTPEAGDGPLQLMVVDAASDGWPVTLTDPN